MSVIEVFKDGDVSTVNDDIDVQDTEQNFSYADDNIMQWAWKDLHRQFKDKR